MKKIMVLVLAINLVGALVLSALSCTTTTAAPNPPPSATEVLYKKTVEEFIKSSSTYKFDGIEGSISFVKAVGSTDGNNSGNVKEWEYTVEYQTRHPGHGDRSGQMLAQQIADHSAVIRVKDGQFQSAICDSVWDILKDNKYKTVVSGTVVSGGDTTLADGPRDAPRIFVYKVQQADGNLINIQYTAYPPSPVGEANRGKITLEFNGGSVKEGDVMEAAGLLDKESNTIVVSEQGDYIKTRAR
jgi:hypothetical protein